MKKEDRINLQNKQLTSILLISCLATCESVISRNAYLEKKWSNYSEFSSGGYKFERLKWMDYREKIRSLLSSVYSMKLIIQMTKSCNDKATQKDVKILIDLIENNDYELVL